MVALVVIFYVVVIVILNSFPSPLQSLLNSQQVTSGLSSKLEGQALELDQLRKGKEELFSELETVKFMVGVLRCLCV